MRIHLLELLAHATNRIYQYSMEMRACFRYGYRWTDRANLCVATMEFHLANLIRWAPRAASTCYRLRLSDTREVNLRRRSGDIFIFHEVFTCGCYQVALRFVPQSSGRIIDLGANVGLTSLWLANHFPEAAFVCVEPNP